MAGECVARIGRQGDYPAVVDDLHRLVDQARLRVVRVDSEELRHGNTGGSVDLASLEWQSRTRESTRIRGKLPDKTMVFDARIVRGQGLRLRHLEGYVGRYRGLISGTSGSGRFSRPFGRRCGSISP